MSHTRLKKLLTAYLQNQLSTAELQELLVYLRQEEPPEALREAIDHILQDGSFEGITDKAQADMVFHQIIQKAAGKGPLQRTLDFLRSWRAAAAALLVLAASGTYFWQLSRQQPAALQDITQRYKNDVLPGGDKATLTLADGSRVVLDSASSGTLARQGGSKILNQTTGQLKYEAEGGVQQTAVLYNTLTTPKGGQYRLILPDGSKVWLNAASTLRFPVRFSDDQRKVTLVAGEAYFEVASVVSKRTGNRKPFKVEVKGMEVNVLGTHFNINAYQNEGAVKTSLLEGSVRVSNQELAAGPAATQQQLLKPGQQATFSTGQEHFTVKTVDVEEIVAWKNNFFHFNGTDIGTIMRQIERWYDVEVIFEGNPPPGHYRGKMSRDVPVSHFLRVLELSGIRFGIENKTITVYEN